MKDKSMMHKAEHQARREFHRDIIGGLRKKRLSGLLKKPEKKSEPEDMGGYDALQEMYDEKK